MKCKKCEQEKGQRVKTTNEYFRTFGEHFCGVIIRGPSGDGVVTIKQDCGCTKTMGDGWLKPENSTCDH